jgi:malate dehydrogenase (quinone)
LLLEKRNYSSIFDYLRTAGISINAFISFFNILSEKVIWQYILKNYLYDIPLIGKRLFLKEARKVVPSLQLSDLRLAKEYGGNQTSNC